MMMIGIIGINTVRSVAILFEEYTKQILLTRNYYGFEQKGNQTGNAEGGAGGRVFLVHIHASMPEILTSNGAGRLRLKTYTSCGLAWFQIVGARLLYSVV